MRQRIALGQTLLLVFLASACDRGASPHAAEAGDRATGTRETAPLLRTAPKSAATSPAVNRPSNVDATMVPHVVTAPPRSLIAADPIIVADCRLVVSQRQEVPSQRDGVLLYVCTDIKPGEPVPPERVVTVRLGDQERRYRRLMEGDAIEAGQLLGLLDDRLARDDWSIKKGQIALNEAALAAAEKARDESQDRYQTQLKLRQSTSGPAASEEEVGGAKLAWYKNHYEAVSRKEAMALAALEFHQAQTVLGMYEIRGTIPGVIKRIYKNPGEAVRSLEPVLEIRNLNRLRVEGLVESQHLPRLHSGMKVFIEPALAQCPAQSLLGHLQPVTGVAVSNEKNSPQVVSASEDGTVRIWDRGTRHELRVWKHPSAVLAVACTAPGAAANLVLSGTAEGTAFIWNLGSPAETPLRALKGQHHGAVTCVAWSTDGKLCATGGDDHQICLWETATGALRYRFPSTHLGAITWLQFLPQSRLLSAGRDNTLQLWTVGERGPRQETSFEHRSGDVARLGASADGSRALFDQGSALGILSLPQGLSQGILRTPSGATSFSTLALFSPDARLILTAGAAEGALQLWRTPNETTRASELRQLVTTERSATTCAAFAPDGSFLVTGSRDRQVMVWPLPDAREIDRQFPAQVTLVEQAVESNARQIRIAAELSNIDGRFVPGTSVTMIIYPSE